MLLIGSDDGVYRIDAFAETDSASTTRLLGADRPKRLRQFDGCEGVFAATVEGLYHSTDGTEWADLGVPETAVYAVGASPDGDRLYAGTRPAAIYATEWDDGDGDEVTGESADAGAVEWRELSGFQDLPSRDEWRLPRHENLAQVRDVTVESGGASGPSGEGSAAGEGESGDGDDRLVAGVEVGGVHVSEDGGETWTERADGVDDDVHELHVVGPDRYVAATGFGLFRTDDAGRSWERLDGDVDQRYFRTAFSVGDEVYAGANLENSSTWDDADADPAAFRVRDDGRLEEIPVPDEAGTVTGMGTYDGRLVLATHRGYVYTEHAGQVEERGRFPVADDPTGRYTPVTWLDA